MNVTCEEPQAHELLAHDRDYLWHPWSPNGASLPLMVAGEGCFVADVNGQRYLDARACTLNAVLGYGHPAVIEVVTRGDFGLLSRDAMAVTLRTSMLRRMQRGVWVSAAELPGCARLELAPLVDSVKPE